MRTMLPKTHPHYFWVLFFFLFGVSGNELSAQVSSYLWSQTTGAAYNLGYNGVADVTMIPDPATGYNQNRPGLFVENWDDLQLTVPLPFNFTYNGVTYTPANSVVGIDTDGWICVGNSPLTMTGNFSGGSWVSTLPPHTGMYLNGSANNNGFAGFNADLNAQTTPNITGTFTNGNRVVTGIASTAGLRVGMRVGGAYIRDGSIITAVTSNSITMSATANATGTTTFNGYSGIVAFVRGTAPNREFVVQWTWAKRWSSPATVGDDFNFQIVLSEDGGVDNGALHVYYGQVTSSVTENLEMQVGLRGNSASDFNARKSTSSWVATTAAVANTDIVIHNNTVTPPSGLQFHWKPCTAPPSGTGSITGSTPVCPGSSQTYTVTGISGASNYTWSYSGSGVTFTATTTSPSNTFNFSNGATGGTITVVPSNPCGSAASINKAIAVTAVTPTSVSYPSAGTCKSTSGTIPATISGVSGGSFSATPSGLTINASSGAITPSSSTPGSYTINYAYNSSGCALVATTSYTIGDVPNVTATATPGMVCSGGSSQLNVTEQTGNNYNMQSIPYSVVTPDVGTTVTTTTSYLDDGYLNAALPFSFTYFGTAVTQFNIISNGHIQMITSPPYPLSGFTAQNIPDVTTPNGVIALCWMDLVLDATTNPGAYIRYYVNGTAPNRVMVVDYNKLRIIAGTSAQEISGQIRLFESTNVIEISVTRVFDDGDTDSRTLGIESMDGTVGYSPAGRNKAIWNVTNEAWRFSPILSSFTYQWTPATYLSDPNIANPVASGMPSTTAFNVKVTNTVTGCFVNKSVSVIVAPPMSGTYTVGSAGDDYLTLTAAVNDYNARCIGGPITFLLTKSAFPYNTGEVYPINIEPNSYQSQVNTLTIKPAPSVNATISGNLLNNALIRIKGNFVKIDGSNNGTESRNLTITNNNASFPIPLIIASGGTTPVTGVVVKNCKVVSASNTAANTGILFTDSSTVYDYGRYTYDTIYNNQILKVSSGIELYGVEESGNGKGIYIANNDLTSTGANSISFNGIYLDHLEDVTIENNKVGNFDATGSGDDVGIWVALGCKNTRVIRNQVFNIGYSGTVGYGGIGMKISTGNNGNNLVANNMIANIYGDGFNYTSTSFGLDNPTAILVLADAANPQSGLKIYHNSINMYGSTLGHSNALSFGIRLTTNNTVDIRNNIVVNSLGKKANPAANGLGAVGIHAAGSASQFSQIDYNDYSINPPIGNKYFGGIGTTGYTTLPSWATAVSGESNALNVSPVFVGSVDLHIANNAANYPLNESCLPLADVPLDYDSTTRNGLRPDMGADEFLRPNTGSWVGRTSIDWLVKSNWETNTIPVSTTDVTVTGGYPHLPTISTTQPLRDLILKTSSPVVTIDGGTMQVYRNFSIENGYIEASNGTMEMMGAAVQHIPAGLFNNNNLLNLIVNNSNAANGVMLDGPVDIYRSVNFGSNGRKLQTGDYLTFKSTATETAWLGQLTSNNAIVGKATIERNIPIHNKAWQLLSTPVNVSAAPTIKNSWQEGATVANGNPNPGFGTQLGSMRADATVQPSPGFDVKSFTPSIKVYNRNINEYVGVNRTDTTIYNPRGYLVFVRGDRSVINFSGPNSTPTQTTMRMKGMLNTPANPPEVINIPSAGFESVGNPYPSAINFRKLTFGGGVKTDFFHLWDPRLTTTGSPYGLGGYQTFSWNGSSFDVVPGGGSFSGPNRNIESGQAFFVQTIGPGTLTFTEAAKESGSYNNNRPMAPVRMKQLRTQLHAVISNNQTELIDGVMIQYGNYSNEVDEKDAVKLNNTGENLSIRNGTKMLSVERRHEIVTSDTVFYRINQMKVHQYEFQFIPNQIAKPGLRAWLEDSYTNTATPISLTDTSYIRFSIINQPGSYAPDRFRLVFVQKKETLKPDKGPIDMPADQIAVQGDKWLKGQPAFTVYPNPVVNHQIQTNMKNMEAGNWMLQLMDDQGHVVMQRSVMINSKDATIKLDARRLASGVYLLLATSPTGERRTATVSMP